MPRPPNYPLDVTPRFTTQGRDAIGKGIGPIGDSGTGILHYSNGDLKVYVAHAQARSANRDVYLALAYLDVIDVKVDAAKDDSEALRALVNGLRQEITDLQVSTRQEIADLQVSTSLMAANLEKVMNFLGVVIPNWQSKEEVEEGDDMGLVNLSASQLGVNVVFSFLQRAEGFSHEQVVSISPPAGTLVARGTTVAVEINLEG
jgi:hypothetical protein